MLDFGKNAVFIWASYAVSALGLGALIVATLRKPRG